MWNLYTLHIFHHILNIAYVMEIHCMNKNFTRVVRYEHENRYVFQAFSHWLIFRLHFCLCYSCSIALYRSVIYLLIWNFPLYMKETFVHTEYLAIVINWQIIFWLLSLSLCSSLYLSAAHLCATNNEHNEYFSSCQ